MSIFSRVKGINPKSNLFSLSHELKTTLNLGDLVPIFHLDCLPGDKIRCSSEIFLRFAPMLAPIMHRVDVYTHFFFVPYRLIWDDWENFITGGPKGTSSPSFPRVRFTNSRELACSSLSDYLGVKTGNVYPKGSNSAVDPIVVSALPYRAYNLIFHEYYRDQNLFPDFDADVATHRDSSFNGIVDYNIYNDAPTDDFFDIRKRCWRKDYFTSALPWTQRGEEMNLPLTGTLPITWFPSDETDVVRDPNDGTLLTPRNGSFVVVTEDGDVNVNGGLASIDNSKSLSADLSDAASISVNDLRRVVAIQRWLEANARGGARYVEQLLMHFGVHPQDSRLQRPEFLGGGKSPAVISEVLQTSATSLDGSDTPQGNMAGRGIAAQSGHSFTYHVKEHGIILGIMSVMPKSAYCQGIDRSYLKTDKFEFGWPELAHLGEQEIYNAELYSNSANTSIPSDSVFGYTPRYAEYKFAADEISGEFRNSLSFWHLGRIFGGTPALNQTFVTSDPSNRIFAVTDQYSVDHLYSQIYFDVKAIRKLPKFGTPSLL